MEDETQDQNKNTSYNANASEFLDKLLNNDHIPAPIAKRFWVLFGLSTKLTFLNEFDVKRKMLEFELLRLTFIKSIPKKEYTPDIKFMLTSVQMEFNFNLTRSRGNVRMNERELEASVTTAAFTERPLDTTEHRTGMFSNVIGMLSGGKKQP